MLRNDYMDADGLLMCVLNEVLSLNAQEFLDWRPLLRSVCGSSMKS